MALARMWTTREVCWLGTLLQRTDKLCASGTNLVLDVLLLYKVHDRFFRVLAWPSFDDLALTIYAVVSTGSNDRGLDTEEE